MRGRHSSFTTLSPPADPPILPMARPFKIFLYIVAGFFALIVLAAIALPLIIDPNDYKDEAATATKDATGRELKITGDIDLTVREAEEAPAAPKRTELPAVLPTTSGYAALAARIEELEAKVERLAGRLGSVLSELGLPAEPEE